jgi:uncharacterized protein YdcH (DUF465 family)
MALPLPRNPELEAREWQQAQELAELERQKDEHFNRMANPFIRINERLEQLEAENQQLRQRLSALEMKANRSPDDW